MQLKLSTEQKKKLNFSLRFINNINDNQDNDIPIHYQILNGELYLYSILKEIEIFSKKNGFYFEPIDFSAKGLKFNEIDSKGNIIEPEWFKKQKNQKTLIVLYNIKGSKYNKQIKMLNELISKGNIRDRKISNNLFFVILNDKENLFEKTGYNLFKIKL